MQATTQDLETWERFDLLGGWQDWELGIDDDDSSSTRSSKSKRKRSSKKNNTTTTPRKRKFVID